MGFRSTLVSEHNYLPLPEWFVEKYKEYLYINGVDKLVEPNRGSLPISSKFEFKTYFPIAEGLPVDIQKVMRENTNGTTKLVLVWLHECGGITRVQIDKESIVYSEPTGWEVTEGVTHDYCYGCSDAPTKYPNNEQKI